MIKYYSQHGEDLILDSISKGQKDGFFVEVGCIEGRRFSNILTFEECGWNGLCVEVYNGYIDLFEKNRSGSIISHCAVGEVDGDDVTVNVVIVLSE